MYYKHVYRLARYLFFPANAAFSTWCEQYFRTCEIPFWRLLLHESKRTSSSIPSWVCVPGMSEDYNMTIRRDNLCVFVRTHWSRSRLSRTQCC